MSKLIDLTGQKFGKLTVIEREKDFIQPSGQHKTMWKCKCDCGNESIIRGTSLRKGETRSCGCISREKPAHLKHAMYGTPTYKSWAEMKHRCKYPEKKKSKCYVGVTYCVRWEDFNNFLVDMGERPKGKTLDRIDGTKGYSPNNCRWATAREQANNLKTNHLITYKGKTQTLQQWSYELGINNTTLGNRLKLGWSIEKTLETPVRKRI